MSIRKGEIIALSGSVQFDNKPEVELHDLFKKVLNDGIYKLCMGTYE